MATNRPFAYNPSHTSVAGTYNIGDLAVGVTKQDYNTQPGGLIWWGSPDEEQGYVIAVPVSGNTQPTPVTTNRLYLSPTYKGTDINLSNNNQTAYQQFGYQQSVLGTNAIGTGDKVMFSVLVSLAQPATLPDSHVIGIGYTDMNYQGNPYGGYPGNDSESFGYGSDGNIYYEGNVSASGFQTWTTGDIIDVVVDSSVNKMWVRVNGGDWDNNPSDNPVTNTGGFGIFGGPFYPVLCPAYEGTMTIQNYPTYGVPSGYLFLGNTLASVKFLGTKVYPNPFDDSTFIGLAETYFNQSFTSATEASIWLTTNGYWNSYPIPVLSLDAGNPLSYPGTGTVWTDTISGKIFNIDYGMGVGPIYTPFGGGSLAFNAVGGQYAECSTSLPDLNTWSVGVWHYYTGNETGGGPCIITEVYPGSTGNINYSLGNNNGGFSAGFFDGGWRTTSATLTPNNWYYIVGTYDGATLNVYVNSGLISSQSYIGDLAISSQGGIRLMRRWDLSDYWDGNLAIVDIYGSALNQSEITSKWNLTKSRFGL